MKDALHKDLGMFAVSGVTVGTAIANINALLTTVLILVNLGYVIWKWRNRMKRP